MSENCTDCKWWQNDGLVCMPEGDFYIGKCRHQSVDCGRTREDFSCDNWERADGRSLPPHGSGP